MSIIQKIRNHLHRAKTFRQTMQAWLGEGARPVSAAISLRRANQCSQCPFNVHGGTGSELLPAAIVRFLEAKNRLKLNVEDEWKLNTCRLCGCYLPLKVHVPMLHIRQFMRQSVADHIAAKKPDCWQIDENVRVSESGGGKSES